MTRKKHRLSGICLLFPVMGYLTGLLALLYGIPYTLGIYLQERPRIYIVDVFFWTGMVIICCCRGKIRQRLRLDAPYRKLGRWEKRFLDISGIFLLVTGFMIIAVKEIGMEERAARIFSGFGSFAVILLEISAVILIQQENQKDYFRYMTAVGEYYLKTELNHFRACQKREEKIRRFRHDINNHFLCMKELTVRGDLDKIKIYLQELQNMLEETSQDFHTGNEIADAILNEKNILARAGNIKISLEGQMQDSIAVQATDICTLFANALDNALEYLQRRKENPKWVSIYIRQQGGMLSLIFQNPVWEDVIVPPGSTAKTKKEEHGMGILNMMYTVEKYKGSLNRTIREENNGRVYSLEILLFVPDSDDS